MKKISQIFWLFAVICFQLTAMENDIPNYTPQEVQITNGVLDVIPHAFEEICDVGFFKIKRPTDINILPMREFTKQFINNTKYSTLGKRNGFDEGNGFFGYEKAQMIRLVIEADYWDKLGRTDVVSDEDPNLPKEIQKESGKLRDFGIEILKSLLRKNKLPEPHWFDATGGSVCGEGSYNLSFNHYDPKNEGKDFGIGAHTDWGLITLLDTTQPGLQIEIKEQWHNLEVDSDSLIVNIGEPFSFLFPHIKPGKHRVVNQETDIRNSITMFINPRIGKFKTNDKQPMVYKYDQKEDKLMDSITVLDYFDKLSKSLLGEKN